MHDRYLHRCAHLASLADARVRDNPQVGALLVHKERILSEGFHRQSGFEHAEIVCLNGVGEDDRPLIPDATLYVSLEPCFIHGRTPPCSERIVREGIRHVVFAQYDRTNRTPGRGAAYLRDRGVHVEVFPDFPATRTASAARLVNLEHGRPFVHLKYALSADGFLRPAIPGSYWITNPISRRLVHRWRTRTNAVIVGAGTYRDDRPQLNSRFFPGPDPEAVVLDPRADGADLNDAAYLKTFLGNLLMRRLGHVTVEGGGTTLSAFYRAGLWDEASIFIGQPRFERGMRAPDLPTGSTLIREEIIGSDRLLSYRPA